jgi:hypothetical protein
MVYQPVHAGRATGSSCTVHLSKGWFPAPGERVFYGRIQIELFTESKIGIASRNFIYGFKLIIVIPVSSTLPKDGFPPTAFIPVGFFCQFRSPKEKTRNR